MILSLGEAFAYLITAHGWVIFLKDGFFSLYQITVDSASFSATNLSSMQVWKMHCQMSAGKTRTSLLINQ